MEADIFLFVVKITDFAVFSELRSMALSWITRSSEYFGSTFLLKQLDAVNWQTHATIAKKFVISLMLRGWTAVARQAPEHRITEHTCSLTWKYSFFSLQPLHKLCFWELVNLFSTRRLCFVLIKILHSVHEREYAVKMRNLCSNFLRNRSN